MKKTLSSEEQTKKFAESLAEEIKEKPSDKATIIALEGDLGSGKTKFTQFFAESLGIEQRVVSPTFLIIKEYNLPKGKYETLYHIDAYRVEEKGLLNLGFKEIAQNPKNIVIIEWADKIRNLVPENARWLKLSHGKNKKERLVETKK